MQPIFEGVTNSIEAIQEKFKTQINKGKINVSIYLTKQPLLGDDFEYNFDKILIEDNGIGLKKDQQSIIFKAFTQVDDSATREHEGTGLGLAITRSFCQIMDGDVSVRSKFGEGACFTIRLPTTHEPLEEPLTVEVDSTVQAKT